MDVPIALGLLIAFVASFLATISGEGEVYYDSIAMFVCFQLIARFLEHGAYRRMTDRITNLSASSPGYANRLNDAAKLDSVEVVPAIRLDVGDRVVVNPGEVIPTDGTIESGTTDIDEAILTGESNVLPRSIDDSVIGGSVNVTNSIVVRVTRPKFRIGAGLHSRPAGKFDCKKTDEPSPYGPHRRKVLRNRGAACSLRLGILDLEREWRMALSHDRGFGRSLSLCALARGTDRVDGGSQRCRETRNFAGSPGSRASSCKSQHLPV